MGVLRFLGTANARAQGQIPELQTSPARYVFKCRVNVSGVNTIGNGTYFYVHTMVNAAANGQGCYCRIQKSADGLNYSFNFYVNGALAQAGGIPAATVEAYTWLRFYMYYDAGASPRGGIYVYNDSGTLLHSGTTTTSVTIASNFQYLRLNAYTGTVGQRGLFTFDGFGIYSTLLSGADRYSTPTPSDAGLISLYFFGDGSPSTTIADSVGTNTLNVVGTENTDHVWETGGTWDETVNTQPATPIVTVTAYDHNSVDASSSAFSDPDAGDTHTASRWLVRHAGGGATVVDTGIDTINLTTITGLGPLPPQTALEILVQHRDSSGDSTSEWSNWSTVATFTTLGVPQVALTAPAVGSISVSAGTVIHITFTATDAEDGNIAATATVTSSNTADGTAGALGTGTPLDLDTTGWSAGTRTITIQATDSDGNIGTASFSLIIVGGAGTGSSYLKARAGVSLLGGF